MNACVQTPDYSMSAPDTSEMAALKADNEERRTRLENIERQLERVLEQLQPLHGGHRSTAASSSGSASMELYQHRQKQARTDDSRTSPLDRDEVLDVVFSLVGIDDYFYTATVCSFWRKQYLKLCCNEASNKGVTKPAATAATAAAAAAASKPKCFTSYRSALMTAARL
jgi:hypothetical protein